MHYRLGLAVLLAALTALIPASASAATSLGALWHLDESSGTTAVDTSGNANHGTINGANRALGRFGGHCASTASTTASSSHVRGHSSRRP
jgi:hypothetical protein